MSKYKNVFMIFLLILCYCKSPLAPDPDPPIVPPIIKEISVDIRYLRKDDNPKCPQLNWDDWINEKVRILEFSLDRENSYMQNINENLFFRQLRLLSGTEYKIYVLDASFSTGVGDPCYKRAHDLSFNGYEVSKDKIHGYGSSRGEYVLVTFDVDGVPSYK